MPSVPFVLSISHFNTVYSVAIMCTVDSCLAKVDLEDIFMTQNSQEDSVIDCIYGYYSLESYELSLLT